MKRSDRNRPVARTGAFYSSYTAAVYHIVMSDCYFYLFIVTFNTANNLSPFALEFNRHDIDGFLEPLI